MSDPASGGADLLALQEIALPPPVSWLPQTIGWLYLLIALLIIAAALGWHQWRRWRANQYRRDALAELAAIEQRLQHDEPNALLQLPALLKRTALGSTHRTQVAALSGTDWQHFLERSAPRAGIDHDTGQRLWQLAYAPQSALRELSRADGAALCAQARRWIRHHAAV